MQQATKTTGQATAAVVVAAPMATSEEVLPPQGPVSRAEEVPAALNGAPGLESTVDEPAEVPPAAAVIEAEVPAGGAQLHRVPSFTLGSPDEGSLRVIHSCTVRLVELNQGDGPKTAAGAAGAGSGPSSPTTASAAVDTSHPAAASYLGSGGVERDSSTVSGGGSLRSLMASAKEGIKKPFQPLSPAKRMLGRRYLLYLSADSLQLLRPTSGGQGWEGGGAADVPGSPTSEYSMGRASGGGGVGGRSLGKKAMDSAAAPFKKAGHLAGIVADKLTGGSKSSEAEPAAEAGRVMVERHGVTAVAGTPPAALVAAEPTLGGSGSGVPATAATVTTTTTTAVAAPLPQGAGVSGSLVARPATAPADVVHEAQGPIVGSGGGRRVTVAKESGYSSDSDGVESSGESVTSNMSTAESGLFTLGIALPQVIGIEQHGRTVVVTYHPNHPQKLSAKKASKQVMRSIFLPIGYPVRAAIKKDSNMKTYLTGEEEEEEEKRWAHSFTLEAYSEQEASTLCDAIWAAMDRLSQALHWVDKGLPLIQTPSPVLITIEGHLPAPTNGVGSFGRGSTKGAALAGRKAGVPLGAGGSPRQDVLATRPAWGKRVELPPHWSQVVSAAVSAAGQAVSAAGQAVSPAGEAVAPGSGSGTPAGGAAGGAAGDESSDDVVMTVWLAGPLGALPAKIAGKELLALCHNGGGRPLMLQAVGSAAPGGGAVRMLLQCIMHSKQAPPPQVGWEEEEEEGLGQQAYGKGLQVQQAVGGWSSLASAQQEPLLLMGAITFVMLASWLQLFVKRASIAGEVLQVVSYMLLSVYGIDCCTRLGLRLATSLRLAQGTPVEAYLEMLPGHLQQRAPAAGAVAAALVASWTQLLITRRSTAGEVLQIVAFFIINLCALVGFFLLARSPLPRQPLPSPAAAGAAASSLSGPRAGRAAPRPSHLAQRHASPQPGTFRQWSLTLLRAELVGGEEEAFQETLIEAGGEGEEEQEEEEEEEGVCDSGEAAALGEVEGARKALAHRLPRAFRELIAQYEGVLNADVADRFLRGYPSKAKAYEALKESAEGRKREGMVGLVDKPPSAHFAAIKRHYRHGVYSLSHKSQSLVWIEADGTWKEAWEGMKGEGVTEQDFYRHMMMCYDYNFNVLDPKPHPRGRTINIVDVGGVSMGDATGEAFRVIARAGNLLNLHFPDRLHTAFVINTPGWFSLIWRVISPMIAKETRDLIKIYSKKDKKSMQQELLALVEPESLPREYGGTNATPLHESDYERQLAQHVLSRSSGSAVPGTVVRPQAAEP